MEKPSRERKVQFSRSMRPELAPFMRKRQQKQVVVLDRFLVWRQGIVKAEKEFI